MKRFIVILVLMMSVLTSCLSESLPKGLYYSDTKDGMLYLQLDGHNDCTLFFEGQKECSAYYDIKQNEMILMGHAETKVSGRSCSWWFGGELGNGIIDGNSFKIQAQRLYSTAPEYYYITFRKH